MIARALVRMPGCYVPKYVVWSGRPCEFPFVTPSTVDIESSYSTMGVKRAVLDCRYRLRRDRFHFRMRLREQIERFCDALTVCGDPP